MSYLKGFGRQRSETLGGDVFVCKSMWIQYAIVARIGEELRLWEHNSPQSVQREGTLHNTMALRFMTSSMHPTKNEMTSAYRAGKKILHLKKASIAY